MLEAIIETAKKLFEKKLGYLVNLKKALSMRRRKSPSAGVIDVGFNRSS
jgi:hypothetical protein